MAKKVLNFLSLFGSMATLLCCALPVFLVLIGLGASFASLTASFPQIMWVGQNKGIVFIITGLMLSVSFFAYIKTKNSCSIENREACQESKNYSKYILFVSVSLYLISLFVSYILPNILF